MTVLITLLFSAAFARDAVVTLQSDSLEEYSVPAKAFAESFKGKVQTFSLHGKKSTAMRIAADLKRDPPPLIIAIGAKAAWIARHKVKEDHGNLRTAGALARHVFWEKQSITQALRHLNARQSKYRFVNGS